MTGLSLPPTVLVAPREGFQRPFPARSIKTRSMSKDIKIAQDPIFGKFSRRPAICRRTMEKASNVRLDTRPKQQAPSAFRLCSPFQASPPRWRTEISLVPRRRDGKHGARICAADLARRGPDPFVGARLSGAGRYDQRLRRGGVSGSSSILASSPRSTRRSNSPASSRTKTGHMAGGHLVRGHRKPWTS